ncbi:NFIL3 like protein [Kryptolebias marmoratus]|uniref:NFIL3 like protein n=1 Tax=Kryptolebias marmoratus TaxID=37003 RepID=UPI0018ACBBC9|nr:NFIL3 like protein [Kryptolebias marmoratus]
MSASASPEASCPSSSSSSSVESSGFLEPGSDRTLFPVTRSSLLPRRLMRLRACRSHLSPAKRRKREMIPAEKKDAAYWDKRRKNNEAAKRSREKRRFKDLLLEGQLVALSEENAQLRAQMLNLQYHSSLEKSKPPCPASPASVLASALSHSPALLQAGLWAPVGTRSPAAMRQQEAAVHQLEATIPCFGSTRRGFNPLGHHYLIPQPDGPCVLPHGALRGPRRPAEAEVDAQRQVSSSDDIPIAAAAPPQTLSSVSAFLPTLDALQHAPAAPYPPHSCVVPHLNHATVLPWQPSYLSKPNVFPGLPVHIQGRQQGPGPGAEEHMQRGFMRRFSAVP